MSGITTHPAYNAVAITPSWLAGRKSFRPFRRWPGSICSRETGTVPRFRPVLREGFANRVRRSADQSVPPRCRYWASWLHPIVTHRNGEIWMESSHTGHRESWKINSPISIEGAELQESVMVAELPSDVALSVVRAYRLGLAWPQGPEVMAQLTDIQGIAEWEQDALSRLDADIAVWAPIAVIAGELQEPGTADGDYLAYACLAIAEWAISIGAGATAILFVETAALVNPFNARRAYLAGRVLRERGRMREAERWLRRSIQLAAGTHDSEAHAMAVEALRGIPGTPDEQ